MEQEGQKNILNLIRCVWAGSQRYGALLWSGDVHSTFESLRRQMAAGLNAGISGIPWWTTDIGGFTGGDPKDPKFRELLVRWFQFGLFCPVTRLHGFRLPFDFDITDAAKMFNKPFGSGSDNEIWSYGEEVYQILRGYLLARERLRPYVTQQMKMAHEKGTPVIRPLFYDNPDDNACWEVEDEYMFGPDILVAPVLYQGMQKRTVYLPQGSNWVDANTAKVHEGGSIIECEAPLDVIPAFIKEGKDIKIFE
jgi:alpha-D-xyloside xylohydrolase